jgi:signal transduction histidine kinase
MTHFAGVRGRVGDILRRWNLDPMWRKQTAFRLFVVLTVLMTSVADIVLWPGHSMMIFFTIPLAIAALTATPSDVLVTCVIVTIFALIDTDIARTPVELWPFTVATLLVVSYLSFQLAVERQRIAARAQNAETARHQMQQFLGMISHDLRSPLTTVYGYAQFSERHLDQGDVEATRRNVRQIGDAARRMQRLVEDLLAAARIGEGRFEIHPVLFDLAECVRQVMAEQQVGTVQHHLVVDGPANLWGIWDSQRIQQAVTNLVSNAIRYSPAGGEIRIRLRSGGGAVQIAVTDQGIGIPPDSIPDLFRPFARLNQDRVTDGTGLGLFITKGIVESHGGQISVSSQCGHGSTFVVTLPSPTVVDGANAPGPAGPALVGRSNGFSHHLS